MFFSKMKTMSKLNRIQSGGREVLSTADITNLIIDLQEAEKKLTRSEFYAVSLLFYELKKYRANVEMDLYSYREEASIIIGAFNRIAPYEKYLKMVRGETQFYRDELKLLLEEHETKSDSLLNCIRGKNSNLNKYFLEKEKDIEDLLVELANSQRANGDEYIDYLTQNCPFLKKERATVFFGVLVSFMKYGKNKSFDMMDSLFTKWIENLNGAEEAYCLSTHISFFCGILFANGVITEEESEQLSKKYLNKQAQHISKFMNNKL